MADTTKIEWTDATWQIVTGCSIVSPGCTNCYAMRLAGTRLQHHPSRQGLTTKTKAGPVWNGTVRFNEQWLDQPLRWKRPRQIFVCAHGDLFHESVPDEWLHKVFAVMALTPQHTYQVLTKRAERMAGYLNGKWGQRVRPWLDKLKPSSLWNGNIVTAWGHLNAGPLPNVWLGVSVEDQTRADERIPHLLDTPAAVRWISAEPLLGPIDLTNLDHTGHQRADQVHGISAIWTGNAIGRPALDWVVAGGESGSGARPAHPDWFRSLRDQCAAAGVPYFFKQHGDWVSVSMVEGSGRHFTFPDGATVRNVGKKAAGALLDGREHREFPT